MTILHPRLFLAICGAACLIAFTPEGRPPPAGRAATGESVTGSSAARVDAPPRSRADDAGRDRRLALAARLSAGGERNDDAAPPPVALLAAIHPAPTPETALSEAAPAAQFAAAEPAASAAPLTKEVAAERRRPPPAIRVCRRSTRGACRRRPRRDRTVPSCRGPRAGLGLAAAAPAQLRGRDALQSGRRCGPRGARPGGERPGPAIGAGMGVPARRRSSVLRGACRLPRHPSYVAKPSLGSRPAGGGTGRASRGSGEGRRVFRQRRAANERGKNRCRARGENDGAQRRGGANRPAPCGATAVSTP